MATASHELRTPLTSLDGMLELLDDDLRSGSPDLEDAIGAAGARPRASRAASAGSPPICSTSRGSTPTSSCAPSRSSSASSAAPCWRSSSSGRASAGSPRASRTPPAPCWALGDPGSVARILRILLDNAVRATPPEREIRVELHDEPRSVTLSVCDEGPGVPEGERELIFERFQRGHDDRGPGRVRPRPGDRPRAGRADGRRARARGPAWPGSNLHVAIAGGSRPR